jgi:endonuclease/exonuclease/phosphatase family metal-dependent hydrolase
MTSSPTDRNNGIEFGNQEAPLADLNGKSALILASYNIRYAVGRHLILSGILRKAGLNIPHRRTEVVTQNIEIAARAFSENSLLPRPDILALQEADKRTGRAGGHHVAAELATQLGFRYVHAAVGIPRGVPPKQREWWLDFEEQIALNDLGDTGVALLSRVAFEEITRIDLPWHDCLWRPRLAVGATIRWYGQPIRLFNVHIDPHGPMGNQHQQIQKVLDQAQEHDGPVVILGDFNSLAHEKATEIRRLMESRGYTTPFATGTATWRGAGLRYHADWIFVRELQVRRSGVVRPLNVSDHWPIWAEVALPIANFRLPI